MPSHPDNSPHPLDIDVQALMRGLVHELRNPLSAILTAASLLNTSPSLDEESAMLLDVVQKESRRMNRILTEFSSFVKPPQSHPEVFDFVKVLRDAVRELQTDGIINEHIGLHDELPAELFVQGDVMQTYQALRHILANAAEAMDHGGTLHLSGVANESGSWLFVEDSGLGLDENSLRQVFQPFFSTKPTATGLGLSIARGLVRAAGGDLTLENRSNGSTSTGVRVSVVLPTAMHVPEEIQGISLKKADVSVH